MDNTEALIDFLSTMLLQQSDSLQIQIDSDGWASLEQLIAAAQRQGRPLDKQAIDAAVAHSANRLARSDDGLFLRLLPAAPPDKPMRPPSDTPPDYLYYPTTTRLLGAVHTHGLRSHSNQLLHLFDDADTANSLAAGLAERVIITVQARSMYERGFPFWRSENGVWLTESVPSEFLL